jgi:hypothetical protein
LLSLSPCLSLSLSYTCSGGLCNLNRVSYEGSYNAQEITLQQKHKGGSCKGVVCMAGEVSDQHNSAEIRLTLLAEMVAR